MSGSLTRDLKLMVTNFTKQWADKFNALNASVDTIRKGVASIASGVAQNLSAVKANLDMNSEATEQLDIFNQIWAKMLQRVVDRAETIDFMMQKGYSSASQLSQDDLALIKAHAQDYFQELFLTCKGQVKEEREAYIKQLRERAEEEYKAAQATKKEETIADEALRGAEQSLSNAGGQGSPIPDGAEVFGG